MKERVFPKGFIESINPDKGYRGISGIDVGNSPVIFHGTAGALLIRIVCIQDIQKVLVIGQVFGDVIQVCDNIEHYGFYTEIFSLCLFTIVVFQGSGRLVQNKNTEKNRDQKYKDKDRQQLFLNFWMLGQDVR